MEYIVIAWLANGTTLQAEGPIEACVSMARIERLYAAQGQPMPATHNGTGERTTVVRWECRAKASGLEVPLT